MRHCLQINRVDVAVASLNRMTKAIYVCGLNDFEYCVSLHVEHPSICPAEITQALQLSPDRCVSVGESKRTPAEKAGRGVYSRTHWHKELTPQAGQSIPEFLSTLIEQLSPAKSFLTQVVSEGGEIECFIGVFANGLCDQSYPPDLLRTLGTLGVSLRFDYYKPETSS